MPILLVLVVLVAPLVLAALLALAVVRGKSWCMSITNDLYV
jgi:hypothetical protein